ncbi:TPA: hypothetical protein ACKPG8_006057 [Pseudomonas aeruginosa]|uniref:hypothetical protein n=1 Tax=Pseudomonas TaxID=286 RepID=UPI000855D78F|nr:hypothetical protein [Pseudomonas aeruginosa]OCX98536.1 MAG: hypothetical protein BCV62_20175 [Pseudomonas sp. K35]EKV5773505.1 hypothetical protein [Pseudomonas aeruginosa]EKX2260134.1 hypothetical protein [Pseudomonas aeruginosa]EKX3032642.1 hypothetical protein [Pseudomonas aeruginosa]EKX3044874.1 hypothetical protein [Pseudomonas aeruginosa]
MATSHPEVNKSELETAYELLGQWALGAALAQGHPVVDKLLERFAPASGNDLFVQRDTRAAEALQAASPLDAEELHGLLPGVLSEDKDAALRWGRSCCGVGARGICWGGGEAAEIRTSEP